jgi:hypothetical protein
VSNPTLLKGKHHRGNSDGIHNLAVHKNLIGGHHKRGSSGSGG